jgi:hypothetical protein
MKSISLGIVLATLSLFACADSGSFAGFSGKLGAGLY